VQVLTHILARGTASRLYQRLIVEDKIATSVGGGWVVHAVEAGEIGFTILATDAQLVAAERVFDEVIADIRAHGITHEELGRAKRSVIADHIYRSGDQYERTRLHGLQAALGYTAEQAAHFSEALSRVTAADVSKVARAYLISRRSVTGTLSRQRGKALSRAAAPDAVRRRV
jgi:zinc protease